MSLLDHAYPEIRSGPIAHNPYPPATYYRGQDAVDTSPFTVQQLEVRPEPNMGIARHHGSPVDVHRIEGPTLDPGRVLTNPGRLRAPNLIANLQPQNFDVPAVIINWAPNPIVQRSYGQYTVAPNDVRNTIPKQILGYSTDALSQQELADAAALAVRRSMYGR